MVGHQDSMGESFVEIKKENYVYCPRCNRLCGFMFPEEKTSEIELIQISIGTKKYPAVSIKSFKTPLKCPICDYDLSDVISIYGDKKK